MFEHHDCLVIVNMGATFNFQQLNQFECRNTSKFDSKETRGRRVQRWKFRLGSNAQLNRTFQSHIHLVSSGVEPSG